MAAAIAIGFYVFYAQTPPALQNTAQYGADACPLVLANTSQSQLLSLINATHVESVEGACALAALAYYNSSGALAKYNVSTNLTLLNRQFLAGHPNLTVLNSSEVTTFPQTPNIFCRVTPPFNSNRECDDDRNASDAFGRSPRNSARLLQCVAFSTPKTGNCAFTNQTSGNGTMDSDLQFGQAMGSYYNVAGRGDWPSPAPWGHQSDHGSSGLCHEGQKPITYEFNITLPSNVTEGPEVIFIPSSKVATTAIEYINGTLVVLNGSNETFRHNKTEGGDGGLFSQDPSSPNWAGYVATVGDSFTNISSSWIVQNALSSIGERLSTQWIGVGGTTGIIAPLIQIGTQSNYYATTHHAAYGAWYEDYPLNQQVNITPFNISQGDKITANVRLTSPPASIIQMWRLTIKDINTGSSYTTNITFAFVSLSDVEWIAERPVHISVSNPCAPLLICVNVSAYANFANFINAPFLSGNATALVEGKQTIGGFGNGAISMVNQNIFGAVDLGNNANPTGFLNPNDGFNVTNFRIGKSWSDKQTVVAGQSYSLKSNTVYNASAAINNSVLGAVGGTGSYSYQWYESRLGGAYNTSTDCANPNSVFCNVTTTPSTKAGPYSFKLQAKTAGGPSWEAVNSTPVTVTVSSLLTCGVAAKVDVNITNGQPTNTSAPFQQMIAVDSANPNLQVVEAPNLQNVMFFYPDCTPIPAWIESGAGSSSTSTVYWLKLPSSIPAFGRTTIFMGFAAENVNNFLNGSVLGEAPQLSPIYGEYDNGASVFPYYARFGSGLPAGWSIRGCDIFDSQPNCTVNNTRPVVTFGGGAMTISVPPLLPGEEGGNYGVAAPVPPAMTLPDFAWDYYGNQYNNIYAAEYSGLVNASGTCSYCIAEGFNSPLSSVYLFVWGNITNVTDFDADKVYTLAATPSTAALSLNYAGTYTAPFAPIAAPRLFDFSTTVNVRVGSRPLTVYWLRARAYPPGGVMPTYMVDPLVYANGTSVALTTTTSTTSTSTTVTTSVAATTIPSNTVNSIA